MEFDSIQVNETVHLFGDTAKPACNLILNVAYASQSSDVRLKDSLNAFFLSACFGDKYMAMTPEEAVKKYTEKYVGDYRNDLEPMYKKDEEDKQDEQSIGAWYSYYKGIESHVQLCNTLILTYRIDYNEYTGGAHGIYMSTFLNLDLRTLAPIRLDDLFAGDYKEQLTDLLWNQLMADNKVATRQELEDMGMFAQEYKQPIPRFIRRLGVVTAPTGAAVQDIRNISYRRNPYLQIILYPALVQGAGAAESIVKGIQMLDKTDVDVIIVGRGGGSIEDLWAFNERNRGQSYF